MLGEPQGTAIFFCLLTGAQQTACIQRAGYWPSRYKFYLSYCIQTKAYRLFRSTKLLVRACRITSLFNLIKITPSMLRPPHFCLSKCLLSLIRNSSFRVIHQKIRTIFCIKLTCLIILVITSLCILLVLPLDESLYVLPS